MGGGSPGPSLEFLEMHLSSDSSNTETLTCDSFHSGKGQGDDQCEWQASSLGMLARPPAVEAWAPCVSLLLFFLLWPSSRLPRLRSLPLQPPPRSTRILPKLYIWAQLLPSKNQLAAPHGSQDQAPHLVRAPAPSLADSHTSPKALAPNPLRLPLSSSWTPPSLGSHP